MQAFKIHFPKWLPTLHTFEWIFEWNFDWTKSGFEKMLLIIPMCARLNQIWQISQVPSRRN